ncbi:MAG: V-type ATP synthase subunit I [Clostridium sp.]|nr:V-type ATP synthase subunit I [Enterocloster citroniae]MCB7066275.1 V-type ATP synthase subunit I [Enterocloster citroniae]MCC8087250.1 V-type ATP synthase subunit I [Clostridium sp.]MCD8281340.1 V-type ATP synthase subunit I [Enterocloster citroniae]
MPMKKVLICGLKKDRKGTLELLQRQGVLEISNVLQEDDMFQKMDVTSSKTVFERNAAIAEQAIMVLSKYAPEDKGMLSSFAGRELLSVEEYEANAVNHDETMKKAYRLQDLAKQIGEHSAMIPKLEQQMEALAPWKSFDLPLDFKGTKKSVAFIGSIQEEISLEQITERLGELAPQADTIDVNIVSASKEQTCLFIVCAKKDAEAVEDGLKKLNFVKPPLSSQVPAKRQQQLEEELSKVRAEIAGAEKAIADMAPDREALKFVMDYYTMRAEKYGVLNGLVQSKRVFLITGYVSVETAPRLEKLLQEKYEVVVEFSEPEEKDDVPVILHNNKFAEPVEGVIESYSLPGKGEIDPSMVVATFYYVLFGLMLSDAAYGLIMVAGTAYCLTKFKNMEDGMKKFMKMFMYCGISTAFWGFMFGSFFGDAVNVIATTFFNRPDIRLAPIWFEPVSLPMKMLVFAFVLGIIHLFTGLGIKFYSCVRSGNLADGIYDAIFWYMLVGGGIVYLLTMSMFTDMLGLTFTLPPIAGTVAAVLAVIGLIGIVLTSGRESKSWFKRILKGLYGAYGITSYLSDILSYSRLLALGLATSVISTVFNKMGSMVGGNIAGAIVFILVFLIGHSLNLAINALGAYVHTNRLHYVEFFGKFYEGGGRKFEPFAIHTKYYKVKEDI